MEYQQKQKNKKLNEKIIKNRIIKIINKITYTRCQPTTFWLHIQHLNSWAVETYDSK